METTPLRREIQARQGYRPLFFVVWGVLIWLASTLVFRVAGQWLLVAHDSMRLAAAYYGAVPVIASVTLPVYYLRRLDANDRVRAAVLTALPGMLLDMVSTLVFDRLFPNLGPGAVGPFSSWLFWAYGLILVSGFVPRGQGQNRRR